MNIIALYVRARARLLRRKVGPADIVLIGGSSVEFWRTSAGDMLPLRSRNFGIGGSTAAQWVDFIHNLVLPCQPKTVFIFAGSNDIHMRGKSAETAFDHLRALFEALHMHLPEAKIYYAGIYLTNQYSAHWQADRECNRLVREYAQHGNVQYIDIPAALADEKGVPLKDIFRRDGEHLNDLGYALWREAIVPQLRG